MALLSIPSFTEPESNLPHRLLMAMQSTMNYKTLILLGISLLSFTISLITYSHSASPSPVVS